MRIKRLSKGMSRPNSRGLTQVMPEKTLIQEVLMRPWLRIPTLFVMALLIMASCSRQEIRPAEWPEIPHAPTDSVDTISVDTTDRVRQLLLDNSEGGTVGLYLKEIGGPVLANFNELFIFDPASTIKALIYFHAMRQVEDGAVIGGEPVTLERQIQRNANTCPSGDETETISFALQQMMVPSSNFWTQAFRDFFSDDAIHATALSLGMMNTQFNRILGCGGPHNQLTLVEAGLLYEAVATGYLQDRDAAYAPLLTDASIFNAIIDEEAVGLGLSTSAVTDIKANRRSALKAGNVTLSGKEYFSVAGWARLAFKNENCTIDPREFVYGAFIDAADEVPSVGIRTVGVELFREQIRSALESWAACEADLEISSSIIDPPAEVDVNTPVTLTVRHLVRNNGPASIIDAQVTTTATTPEDCTVIPGNTTQDALGLVMGVVRVVEEEIELECSEPSFHEFSVSAVVAPLNPNVVDPDTSNNASDAAATIAIIAYADLAILAWDLSKLENAGIQDLLVGQPFSFETPKVLHNFGDTVNNNYQMPVDATVTASMEIPAGIRGSIKDDNITAWINGPFTISRNVAVVGLEIGVDRNIIETFGIECLEPGQYTIALTNELWADDEHILDPEPSNNIVKVEHVIECVTPVQINIRPGNAHNFVSPNSNQSVPIAILTTEAGEYDLPLDFDATTVDHATVRFGTAEMLNAGEGTVASPDRDFTRDSFEMDDKTKDGDLDMVLLFSVPGSGINTQTTEACLIGSYQSEDASPYTFFGCDAVQISGPET